MNTRTRTRTAFAAFVGVVIAANGLTWAVDGLWWPMVTAGTYLAGFAFVARDQLQDAAGDRSGRWVTAAIVAGCIVSGLFSPALAIASCVAFLLSELADWGLYSRLRAAGKYRAAWWSNLVGAVLDTIVFLGIAQALMLSPFIHLTTGAVIAQVAVKVGVTSLFLVAMATVRTRRQVVTA